MACWPKAIRVRSPIRAHAIWILIGSFEVLYTKKSVPVYGYLQITAMFHVKYFLQSLHLVENRWRLFGTGRDVWL